MDLDHIRTKLNHQVKMRPPVASHVAADWPKIQLPRSGDAPGKSVPRPTQPRELVNAVETLQRREEHYGTPLQSGAATPGQAETSAMDDRVRQEVHIHIKRLQALAEKINALSGEQEHLMGEINAVESRLEQLQLQGYSSTEVGLPVPKIHLDRAVLASAETDPDANLLITYRSPNLPQPEHDAHALADHLRGTYGPRAKTSGPGFWFRLMQEFDLVWQEPATLMAQFWQQVQGLGNRGQASASVGGAARLSASPVSAWRALSPIDMLLWFGGGLIGRVALSLLLSAMPGLWSLAVAALTGITAYALYRATLAPRKDFGLAYRVFLMITGLVIGGQL